MGVVQMPVFAFVAALALAPALCAAADGEQVLLSPTPTTRKSGGYDDMGSDELLRLQNENEQLLAEKAIVAAEADKWNAKLKDMLSGLNLGGMGLNVMTPGQVVSSNIAPQKHAGADGGGGMMVGR